ncbi:hypothetical protein DUNSADRAFT_5565 [Dunaliella salina]|uniref:Guanylate cyclase domain-containing protein n=1 Tax=Dunaliella salina TaxID=3046 RepID=A0ABQ7GQ05_DUNSA|nr:hypothetical protein DUNSADRAFT_5565 [Dunaliella salina]|eukprot:KAF5836692.1 hypothetical protein DUNSADRAFT_5565 [Dunaliella salina]
MPVQNLFGAHLWRVSMCRRCRTWHFGAALELHGRGATPGSLMRSSTIDAQKVQDINEGSKGPTSEDQVLRRKHSIFQAMDGQEALDMLEDMDAPPDIILLDVMMPGMSGYEVKPFGRQEIIARINAHLRFRSAVTDLAEVEAAENLAAQRGVSAELLRIAKVESKHFSLPFNIKSQVENSNGMPSMLKMFDQLTMVIIGISNFDALSAAMVPEELALMLALLHARLDDLLLQHGCYLVDNGEGRILVVTGARVWVHVFHTNAHLDDLLLQHSCYVAGTSEGRILVVTNRAAQLEATCPPSCIHVSKRVMECSGCPDNFVVAVMPGKSASKGDCSYLHKSGNWKSQHALLPALVERYAAMHPFGPFNSVATQLRPIQQALMLLLRRQPELVVEFVSGCSSIRPLRAGGPRSPLQAASPWSQNAGNLQSKQEPQQQQQQQQQQQGGWPASSTGSMCSMGNPRVSVGKRASAQGDGTSTWVAGGSTAGGSRTSMGHGPRSGVGAGARSEMMHLESQMNPQKRQSLTLGTKQHSTEEAWGLPLASGVISRSSVSMDANMRQAPGEHASGRGGNVSLGGAHSEGGHASVCSSDRGGVTTPGAGGNGLDAASFAELQHDKDLVEQQLEEVSNEASRLQDIVDCLEAEVLAQSDLRTRLEESQAQMEELSKERTRLQTDLEETNVQAARLQARLEELGGHSEQLAAALEASMVQKESLAAQLAESDKERARLATYLSTAPPPPSYPPSSANSSYAGKQMDYSRGPASGFWLPTPPFQVAPQLPQAPPARSSMERQLADVQNAQRVTESQLAAAEAALYELRQQYLVDSGHSASMQQPCSGLDPTAAAAAAAVASQGVDGMMRNGSSGVVDEGEGETEQQRLQARAGESSMQSLHGPYASAGSRNNEQQVMERPSSRSSVPVHPRASDGPAPPSAFFHAPPPSPLMDTVFQHIHPSRDVQVYAPHLPQGPACLFPGSGFPQAPPGPMSAAAATSALLARGTPTPQPPLATTQHPQQLAAAARMSQHHHQVTQHSRALRASVPNTPLVGGGSSTGSVVRSPPSRSSTRLSLVQPQAQLFQGGVTNEGLGAPSTRAARQSSSNLSFGEGAAPGMMGILASAGLAHLLPNFEAQEVSEPALVRCMDDGTLESLGVNTVGARLRLRLVAAAADEAGQQ